MKLFLNFFKNHGLFKIKNRPQWYTVTGRSKVYVNKVLKLLVVNILKTMKLKVFTEIKKCEIILWIIK